MNPFQESYDSINRLLPKAHNIIVRHNGLKFFVDQELSRILPLGYMHCDELTGRFIEDDSYSCWGVFLYRPILVEQGGETYTTDTLTFKGSLDSALVVARWFDARLGNISGVPHGCLPRTASWSFAAKELWEAHWNPYKEIAIENGVLISGFTKVRQPKAVSRLVEGDIQRSFAVNQIQ